MTNKILKQWDLKKGDKVKLPDNMILVFHHMDGMYAKWFDEKDTEQKDLLTGSFHALRKEGKYYIPVTPDQE